MGGIVAGLILSVLSFVLATRALKVSVRFHRSMSTVPPELKRMVRSLTVFTAWGSLVLFAVAIDLIVAAITDEPAPEWLGTLLAAAAAVGLLVGAFALRETYNLRHHPDIARYKEIAGGMFWH